MVNVQLDAAGRLKVEYDRTLALYRQAPGAALVSLAAAAGLVFVGLDATDSTIQWVWGAVMGILVILRVILAVACRRSSITPKSAPRWNTLYVSLVVMTGIHFALWTGLCFTDLPVLHRLVAALIFGAMAGGAIAVLSVRRWLAMSYGMLLLLPPSLLMWLNGDPMETVAGILGLSYLATMHTSVKATSESVVAAFEYSHLNEGLLAESHGQRIDLAIANRQLESAQVELEQTNRELEFRITERTTELEWIATHDSLTGLSNRRRLAELTDIAIEADSTSIAVYLLDLDGFKEINDSMGHAIGDQVLLRVARRLERMATDSSTFALARWGGDEFVIIRRRTTLAGDPFDYAQTLLATLREPIDGDAFSVSIDASVGVAFWPEDGITLGELIDCADMAVYSAKAVGRGEVRRFTQDMSDSARRNLKLKHSLSQALASQDPLLRLDYQPIFDAQSGAIESFEALARWTHEELGEISPVEFIAVAETSGDIVPLGEWILHQACIFASSLATSASNAQPSINVNISAKQLKHPGFWTSVRTALSASGLEPERLTLELTESVFALDSEQAFEVLQNIEALGVQLAIDDFGTGYSSLSYLQRIHAGTLKIDRSFVNTLDSGGRPIIEASLSLARAFGMRVVAEGIENRFQFETLKSLGADSLQGFLLSAPQAEHDARALAGSPCMKASPTRVSECHAFADSKIDSEREMLGQLRQA